MDANGRIASFSGGGLQVFTVRGVVLESTIPLSHAVRDAFGTCNPGAWNDDPAFVFDKVCGHSRRNREFHNDHQLAESPI
jgi:hypothetical protein